MQALTTPMACLYHHYSGAGRRQQRPYPVGDGVAYLFSHALVVKVCYIGHKASSPIWLTV